MVVIWLRNLKPRLVIFRVEPDWALSFHIVYVLQIYCVNTCRIFARYFRHTFLF
jgi:hypothetical protein